MAEGTLWSFENICIFIVVFNMLIGWLVLVEGLPVYYGRLNKSWIGIMVNPKLAWFLFEVPNLLWVAYFLLIKQAPLSLGMILFAGHYINRDIIYPLRLKTKTPVPIQIILSAGLFTFANGYLQCIGNSSIVHSSYNLVTLAGLLLFVGGMAINIYSDEILQRVQAECKSEKGPKRYKIINEFLFTLVSSPNYLGQVIQWFGYWIVARHSFALLFALSTLNILTPGAIKRHKWNQANINGYPTQRKAIFPYLL